MIEYFDKTITSYKSTYADFFSSLDLIVYTIQNTIDTDEEFECLNLVYLSDFSTEFNYYMTFMERFSVKYKETTILHKIPTLVLWNVSKKGIFELPCSIYQPNIVLFSGFSPYLLNNLHCCKKKDVTPHTMVCDILMNKQSSHYNQYINNIIKI
jgi:hypothetical protein